MNTFTIVLMLGLVSVQGSNVQANPIRKVVNMLQAMEKKVTAEGAKEQALFDKYMCYCKNSGGDLSKSIGSANTKIPQVGSDIKEGEAKLVQLKEDLSSIRWTAPLPRLLWPTQQLSATRRQPHMGQSRVN